MYAALLLKKANRSHCITVFDRNPPDATYGWGVVFSDETLTFLQDADPETYADIARAFVRWEAIDIRYRGETVRSGGHAFSGLARRTLLNIVQNRCRSLGVNLRFETEVPDLSRLQDCDLIIAADGVNSQIRAAHADVFKPSFDVHRTKFIWLGAALPLDAFTFSFRETEYGMFQAHAYPFERGDVRGSCLSTFIVECNETPWKRAGLDSAGEEESLRFCERLFAEDLQGCSLLSNRSTWINFVTLRNETWHHTNIVLLGDAAHTAHFSVGSGTKMAMEDAIGLTEALQRHERLGDALVEYEELRQPIVERTQMAARDSSLWFEHVPRYTRFEPTQFAFSLLTRSKRITYDNLKLRDPLFSDRVDRWFSRSAAQALQPANGTLFQITQPALNPLRLRGMTVPNRVVCTCTAMDTCEDALPGDWQLLQLGGRAAEGAGLVMTEMVAVSPQGRVSPGSAGLYATDQVRAWKRIVESIHDASTARIAISIGHAGRRGATRPRREGADRPLRSDTWPLLSASPLPYTPRSQVPKEMDRADMDTVRDQFVRSTELALEAGFDMLELHFGHGYLVASFLSPLTNTRADEYGGTLENRLRFPLEVLQSVRAIWPPDRPLSVCMSATDWARGGIDEGEAVAIASAFKAHGCDLVNVVTGQATFEANPSYGRAWQTPFSDLIRNEARVPTMTSGRITTADEINTILAAGRADLCILAARPLNDVRTLLGGTQPARQAAPSAPKL